MIVQYLCLYCFVLYSVPVCDHSNEIIGGFVLFHCDCGLFSKIALKIVHFMKLCQYFTHVKY